MLEFHKVEAVKSSWTCVDIDVSKNGNALSTFQQLCLWLELEAKEHWTYDQSKLAANIITFWIRDPKLAVLFKLTWA